MKFFSTVEEMAHMSPMCSMMVARAMGIIMAMAEASRLPFTPSVAKENTVSFSWKGRPTQAASFTGVKSTRPHTAATT